MILGTMIAAASLAATAARAQGSDAGTEAAATEQSAQQKLPPYGAYYNGPVTPDADGVPVPNPNPMSEYLDDADEGPPIDMPLVNPPQADSSATDSAAP
jgi:hypothetical protein